MKNFREIIFTKIFVKLISRKKIFELGIWPCTVSYLHSTSAQSNISLSNVVLRCGPIASHVFVNEYLHDTKKPNITLPGDKIKARKKCCYDLICV